LGLIPNNTVLTFDARLNPGFTDKIYKNFALVMLKNIERMKKQGIVIKDEWINPDLYAY